MIENLNEKAIVKGIGIIRKGCKEFICDFLQDKIQDKIEHSKEVKLINSISEYISEEDEKERVKNYIDRVMYNNTKTLSQDYKNNFKEQFFKKYGMYSIYREEIEKVFEEYFEFMDKYEKNTLSKSEKIIVRKINESAEDNLKQHKYTRQGVKESEANIIKAIRENDKIGMICIEENGIVEFEVLDIEEYPEDIVYHFFGGTVNFDDSNKITSKLMMKIKVKNVGTDLLYNVIVKKFEIYIINEYDNDSYSMIETCSYNEERIIKNTILPGTVSGLNFIFAPFEFKNPFDDSIFDEFKEKIEIHLSFDIKLKNEDVISEEIVVNCSRIDDSYKKYIIDAVTTTFNNSKKF